MVGCPKCQVATAEWLFKSEMWWCNSCHLIFSRPIELSQDNISYKTPQEVSADDQLRETLLSAS